MASRRKSRASGEGTLVFDENDGRWHGWVDMGIGVGGKRERRHVAAPSQADVVKKLRDLATKRDAGVVPSADRSPSLAQWLAYYLDNIAARHVRPSTLVSYRWIVDKRVVPLLGHHRLDRSQPEHIEALYGSCDRSVGGFTLRCGRVVVGTCRRGRAWPGRRGLRVSGSRRRSW
jgi:integrase